MASHGGVWQAMGVYGKPGGIWQAMGVYGKPWCMESHNKPWGSSS